MFLRDYTLFPAERDEPVKPPAEKRVALGEVDQNRAFGGPGKAKGASKNANKERIGDFELISGPSVRMFAAEAMLEEAEQTHVSNIETMKRLASCDMKTVAECMFEEWDALAETFMPVVATDTQKVSETIEIEPMYDLVYPTVMAFEPI